MMPVVQPMKRIKPATAEDYHRRVYLRYSTSEYGDERLPEWVEGGPKNTDETVELRGFEEESEKGECRLQPPPLHGVPRCSSIFRQHLCSEPRAGERGEAAGRRRR
jgi:hypothetical protein